MMSTQQPDAKRPMELEGSLSAFSVPEILQFLSLGRMTGELSIRQLDYRLVISIIRGKIVNTQASSRINQIGQMLVNRGLVSADVMEHFLETQRLIDPGKKIGELLVERKVVSADHLNDCLRVQIEEEIWPLFNQQEGDFKFENKPEGEVAALPVRLDIEALIMEGTRRRDEWEIIQRRIPNDRVVMMASLPQPEVPEGPGADTIRRAFHYETPRLRPAEWDILAKVDGVTTVRAICQTSPVGAFETFHALYALMESGFLKTKGEMLTDSLDAPDFRRLQWDPVGPSEDASNGGGAVSQVRSFLMRDRASSDSSCSACVSPVSCLAHFISALTQAFTRHKGFGRGQAEQELLCRHWQQTLMDNPLADMIRFTGFGLDATRFDAYIQAAGGVFPEIEGVTHGCLNAMTQYLEMLVETARQRLGAKATKPIVQRMLERYAETSIQNGERWEIASRLAT